MDAQRWERAKAILAEALGIAPAERDSFLESACGCDPELLEETRSLLEAHDRSGEFLTDSRWRAGPSLDRPGGRANS